MMLKDFETATVDDEGVLDEGQRVESHGPADTERVAVNFARRLQIGDLVAFHGELGSGKTTFIRGLCKGLQVSGEVTSPTFTLIHEYNGSVPVYHFDFYRVTNPMEISQLGCDEYFFGDGICLIEWADRVADYLPDNRFEVHLKHRFSAGNEDDREIVIRRL